MIEISGLSVHFGGVCALDGVSLRICDDVAGIIGPNGAGKSTLVNVLSGFVRPSSGSVLVEGTDLLSLSPHRRARWGLSRSFQKVQIVDDLRVEDHVQVVLDARQRTRHEREKTTRDVLAYVGLTSRAGALGAELNQFERRMTEIARCLAAAPRIVLLDEPGGGLSEVETARLRAVIEGIRPRFGAQVLLIDHDVDLIRAVCGRTAVLDFGRLIAFGPTRTVLQDDQVKAAYLGR
ncbi:ATP-binding cassette domain-containing protein [Nitratireductor sp. XY-223]|uniref:ABC transporter ATP-binding protein n=1 Tax=Nitratireductor sp. XY-223 TaxID=2561926 RepID=UPI0010AAAACA|nr:ATP-binding cassette domain-containing protein [Nitratireductor sp. XY-223]